MAVGKVRRRRHRPWRSFLLLHIEQAPIERQKGHQEEGRRPLLAKGYVATVCFSGHSSTSHVDWYDIKAPSIFEVRNVGKTLANRSQGLSMSPVHLAPMHLINSL